MENQKQLPPKINYAPALSLTERQMVLACQNSSARIMFLTKKDIKLRLDEIITKAYEHAGQQSKNSPENNQTHNKFVESFSDELLAWFGILTMDEVEIAFYNGLRGEYGEYFGINNVTAHMFCSKYRDGAKRKDAKEKQRLHEEKMKKQDEISEEKKNKIFYVGALRKFTEYRKNGTVYDAGGATYDYLTRLGILNYNEEARQIFKDRAKHKLREQATNRGKDRTMSLFQIQDFIKSITDENFTVICEAKSMILCDFFKALVDLDMHLYQKLEEVLKTEDGI